MGGVGVLALQGGVASHLEALARAGVAGAREVRSAREIGGLDGLVLPGGESSVMRLLMRGEGLDEAIIAHARAGKPLLATCAGLIVIAREVQDPAQESLGLLDVVVSRNAWGRQLASFEARDDDGARHLVFIRAPRIREAGPGVEVLARYRGEPILVRQGSIVGACHHPELDPRSSLHAEIFARDQRGLASAASTSGTARSRSYTTA